ncbi:uncharacterized protein [Antedon mediterranea]|uniref:uncharacterized protein n=1 Tax=Antedon mediterranea TaxID=105859 RepID=UPI003AF73648
MTFHKLFGVVFVSVLFLRYVHSLDPNGRNVCTFLVRPSLQTYISSREYSSSYTTSTMCGIFDWDRCSSTRYRTSYRTVILYRTVYSNTYRCCSGYTSLPGSNECTEPICEFDCINGKCDEPNHCECYKGYHGPTCQYNCTTDIDNCQIVDCSTHLDSFCTRCMYYINMEIKAYQLIKGECIKICSWRSNSRSCYPGTCGLTSDICSCDIEFDDGDNCMNMTVPPKDISCSISLQLNGISSIDIPCVYSAAPPTYSYSSVDGNALSINWQTSFPGPSSDKYPFPYYINDYRVGISSSYCYWEHIRGKSIIETGYLNCGFDIGPNNPKQGLHSCEEFARLSEQLQHDDSDSNISADFSLFFSANATNGGYIERKNYDFSNTGNETTDREYYQGQSITMYVNVKIDTEPPTHCSVQGVVPCVGNALDVGEPYTRLNEVDIRWTSWVDYISGLRPRPSYNCRIYKMAARNDILIPDNEFGPLKYRQSGDEYQVTFTPLPSPGVYCIILTVNDVAGNVRNARRCIIYDNQSEITTVEDKPIYLTISGKRFNNNSDVSVKAYENVTLSWNGHFINQLHVDQNLLLAIISDDDVTFQEAYDSEAHPAGRPLSAIGNANGIIKFEFGLLKNSIEGETFESVKPEWRVLKTHEETVNIYFKDEEDSGTYQIWVQATDVIGNTKIDFALVHIDVTNEKSSSSSSSSSSYNHVVYAGVGLLIFIMAACLLVVFYCQKKKHRGFKKKTAVRNSKQNNRNMYVDSMNLDNTYQSPETSFPNNTVVQKVNCVSQEESYQELITSDRAGEVNQGFNTFEDDLDDGSYIDLEEENNSEKAPVRRVRIDDTYLTVATPEKDNSDDDSNLYLELLDAPTEQDTRAGGDDDTYTTLASTDEGKSNDYSCLNLESDGPAERVDDNTYQDLSSLKKHNSNDYSCLNWESDGTAKGVDDDTYQALALPKNDNSNYRCLNLDVSPPTEQDTRRARVDDDAYQSVRSPEKDDINDYSRLNLEVTPPAEQDTQHTRVNDDTYQSVQSPEGDDSNYYSCPNAEVNVPVEQETSTCVDDDQTLASTKKGNSNEYNHLNFSQVNVVEDDTYQTITSRRH